MPAILLLWRFAAALVAHDWVRHYLYFSLILAKLTP